eukprot:829126_1
MNPSMLYDGHIQHIQTHTNVMLCTDYNMSIWQSFYPYLYTHSMDSFFLCYLMSIQASSHVHKVMGKCMHKQNLDLEETKANSFNKKPSIGTCLMSSRVLIKRQKMQSIPSHSE